jgi:hypothetical protein
MSLDTRDDTNQICDEESLWENNGRYSMRDFVCGMYSKAGYFGPSGRSLGTWEEFWLFLDVSPIPTVQEWYSDTKTMDPTIRGCPSKIANINRIVAALNVTRNVIEYKKLMNEFILTCSPEAATNKDLLFHRDIQ